MSGAPLRSTSTARRGAIVSACSGQAYQQRGAPVVSVDAKKKELVGDYQNGGREWQPKGSPEKVQVHDFPDKKKGKTTPYGVYDLTGNEGWVSVGTDRDTAEFAVQTDTLLVASDGLESVSGRAGVADYGVAPAGGTRSSIACSVTSRKTGGGNR